MNPTLDVIYKHRSIREFTPQALTDEQRAALVRAARSVSSSSFLQCTSIIRITDKTIRAKLAELAANQAFVAQAPEFWVFCADFNRHLKIDPNAKLGFTEQLLLGSVDTAIMAQTVLVAAESMGLGGVYVGAIRNNIEAAGELLGLPEQVAVLFGLCLGYPAQNPEVKPKLPAEILMHENRYQTLDFDALAKYDEEIAQYYHSRSDNQREETWSNHVKGRLQRESRPFVLDYLRKQGIALR